MQPQHPLHDKLNYGDMEGFHVERIPELTYAPRDVLSDKTAVRAVWRLIYHERWEELYELGLEEEPLRGRLLRVGHYGEVLTDGQYRWLRRLLPEIVEASIRLRELYVLKQFLRSR